MAPPNGAWCQSHRRAMLAALADNPEPWRDVATVATVRDRFTPWHDSSWPIVAASMSGKASAMADQWRVSARACVRLHQTQDCRQPKGQGCEAELLGKRLSRMGICGTCTRDAH